MDKKKVKNERPAARAKSKYTIYNVKESAELMEFLMKSMDGISRTTVKSMLTKRRILVDNNITTLYNFQLKPGMKVQISQSKNNKEFQNNQVKLVYEDAYLLVAEKKEGIFSAPQGKAKERSVQNILLEYVKRYAKERKIYPVRSLDKDTSGLIIFAKDEKTRNTILDYWDEIITDQRFVAVLSGDIEKDGGMVTTWMQDNKIQVSFSHTGVDKEERATTYYKTIKRKNGYSLVELELENGRKNQIRSHMADLGYPIVGDPKYGDDSNPLGRMALHAFKLYFNHPVTGEKLKFDTLYPSSFKGLVTKQQQEDKVNKTGQ